MMMMISASSSQHFACIQRRLAAVVQCKFISHRWMHLFEWKSACIELALEPFQFRFSYTFDWTKLICSPFRSRISFSPAPPLSPLPWSMSRHTQEIHSNWFHMKKFIVKNRENEFISVIWFGWHDDIQQVADNCQFRKHILNWWCLCGMICRKKCLLETFIFHHFLSFLRLNQYEKLKLIS